MFSRSVRQITWTCAKNQLCKGQMLKPTFVVRNLGTYKTSTGLVGLAVDPDGKNTLLKLSTDIIESVKVLYDLLFSQTNCTIII